jgi:predicted permease
MSGIQAFSHDLRYALRGLRRSPGYAVVTIATLAVGIGATTAVFTAVDGLLLRPLGVERPGQLVVLQSAPTAGALAYASGSFPYAFYEQLRETDTGFSDVLPQLSAPVALAWPDSARRARVAFVTPNFFRALGVVPALGRTFDAYAEDTAAVVSHRLWQSQFGGDSQIVGMGITVGGRPFVVAGIAPPGFTGTEVGREVDAWVPIDTFEEVFHQPSGKPAVGVMGRLAPGVNREQAAARTTVAFQQWRASDPDSRGDSPLGAVTLLPGGQGFRSTLREQLRSTVWLLLAACACLWLIATVNASGLSLARFSARSREVGIRLALGAGWTGLARQMLAESLLLATLGGALGLLLAGQLTQNLPGLMSTWAGVDLRTNLTVLGTAMLMSFLAAVLITVVQILAAHRRSVLSFLTGHISVGMRGRMGSARRVVITQVALAVPLVAGAMLFAQTLQNLLSVDAGFGNEKLLQVEVEPLSVGYSQEQAEAYYAELLDRLRRVPGIVDAAVDNAGALSGFAATTQVRTPEGDQSVSAVLVGDRYFEAMSIPAVAGRPFRAADHEDGVLVAVLNESLARNLFGSSTRAVGRTVSLLPAHERTIVGVVEDTIYLELRTQSTPLVYFPRAHRARHLLVHVRTRGDPAAMIPTIHAVARDVDSQVPLLSVQTFAGLKGLRARRERLMMLSLGAVGWVALVLSALGLYGLVSYAVVARTRDIGIRAALGGRRRHIISPFLKDTVSIVATGGVLGVVGAVVASRLIESQLYGTEATSPITPLGAIGLLVAVSAIALFGPLRRALSVDPSVALRSE